MEELVAVLLLVVLVLIAWLVLAIWLIGWEVHVLSWVSEVTNKLLNATCTCTCNW